MKWIGEQGAVLVKQGEIHTPSVKPNAIQPNAVFHGSRDTGFDFFP